MILSCVKQLSAIAKMLAPFMPDTSSTIIAAVKANKKPENLFPRI
jgi:methionyl-tRNA synthetase